LSEIDLAQLIERGRVKEVARRQDQVVVEVPPAEVVTC